MIALPETTVRIASSEDTILSIGAGQTVAKATVTPRFGRKGDFPVSDGSFRFPALAAPDLASIEWIGTDGDRLLTSYVEVVSRHYFDIEDLRMFGDGQDEFDGMSDDALIQARQAATEVFERSARRSFVERVGRTKDYGADQFVELAHNDVRELLVDGYRLVSDCQVVRDGSAPRPFPVWIEYLYGAEQIPAQVSRSVLELAAYMLRPTNRPIGATGESTDAGYIHFTTAGRDGATDIPEVNAAIEQFGRGARCVW
ncbi:MAG: hypothetical protein SOW20_04555 [Berryella intestinalis]|uniref:hypothetical protein n=1 Tax=Berryella intestinalis TaxID=1531429 RepID=UPI002A50C39A|nr:hypothetical protein [Berryella intestinalis]MDD7369718.1 hypothetical protein [Berryella intestinalis]MDY3129283.1 hypothetical protein [Berryella intestinalis]